MTKSLAHLKPSAPFKSLYQYNNIAYNTVSSLPELLLGQKFDEFIKNIILGPLGMNHSFYDIELARATQDLSSAFARKISIGRSGLQDVEVAREDIKAGRRLSNEGRGIEQALGWPVQFWQGGAGAGGIVTCSKDLVSHQALITEQKPIQHVD